MLYLGRHPLRMVVQSSTSGPKESERRWAICPQWWPKVKCHFHYKGLESKSRKSRNTWNNRQILRWSTEWSRAKANGVLPRECTGHSKHSSNNTRKDSTHGLHQVANTEIRLIILFAAKDGKTLYSQQKQYQELTVAQIMNTVLPNSGLNWRN